jgi:hypothetical protein
MTTQKAVEFIFADDRDRLGGAADPIYGFIPQIVAERTFVIG